MRAKFSAKKRKIEFLFISFLRSEKNRIIGFVKTKTPTFLKTALTEITDRRRERELRRRWLEDRKKERKEQRGVKRRTALFGSRFELSISNFSERIKD